MQITEIGYEKILDAQARQIKLQISKFKVGTGTDYNPVKEDTTLHGDIVYSGDVSTVDVLTDEVMDFVCVVPVTAQAGGPLFIGEIGLYIEDPDTPGLDILFALTCYAEPIIKQYGQIYKTHCVLLSPYLGSVVDLTLMWAMSLPRVNFYGDLPNPNKTGSNAYVVNHGITKEYSPTNSQIHPSVVTRYSMTDTGPLAWGLLNGSLLYQGTVDNVSPNVLESSPGAGDGSNNTFILHGALLVDSPPPLVSVDWAFMYVYSGRGKGQCRAIKYHETGLLAGKFEVLYEALSILGATSGFATGSEAEDVGDGSTSVSESQVVNLAATNETDKSSIIIWSLPYSKVAGLVYAGRWNIKNPDGSYAGSSGFPNNGLIPGSYYVIAVGGVLNNVAYQAGDWLVYEGVGIWDKLDNTELPYMLYKGLWDASTGAYPPEQPKTIFTELRQGHYWRISVEGTLNDIHFNVNDYLIYEGGSSWGKIIGTRRSIAAGSGIQVNNNPYTEEATIINTTKNVHSISVVNTPSTGLGAQNPIAMTLLQDGFTLAGDIGIAITTDPQSKTVSFKSIGAQTSFTKVAVQGQATLVSDSPEDTLTLVAGGQLTITTDPLTDSITISAAGPNLSAEKQPDAYSLLAYDMSSAGGTKSMVPSKDVTLGNALKIIFTADPSNPAYVPFMSSLPGEFCNCTCTCTCNCNHGKCMKA